MTLWRHSEDTLKTLWWHSEHTLNILRTHSEHTLNTLWTHSEDTLNILWRYAQDLTKSQKHYPLSNMDPRDASASKNYLSLWVFKSCTEIWYFTSYLSGLPSPIFEIIFGNLMILHENGALGEKNSIFITIMAVWSFQSFENWSKWFFFVK